MNPLYIFLGVLVVIALYFIIVYNNFIKKDNAIKETFGTIDVFLKQRYDLIPNLVEIAKVHMKFEMDILTNITALRSQTVSSKLNNDERVKLDNEINKQIKGIMIAVENYPNLKSNDRFKDITNSMTEIEDELQASRRTYNAAVIDYNNYLQMIPSNIVGKLSGYKVKTLFEAFEKERENINVKELFNS